MRLSMRWEWMVVALTLLLGGCGGGGSAPPQATLNLATTTVQFNAYTTDPTPSVQFVDGSVSNATQSIYLTLAFTNKALENVGLQMTGQTTARLVVAPKAPGLLAPGTYTDTVTVYASLDAAGTRQIAGSPRIVTSTYKVGQHLTVGASTLGFAAALGGPAPVGQNLSIGGAGLAWQASTGASWIHLGASSGTAPSTLAITADPAGLAAGIHTGTVAVTVPGTSEARTVAVTLDLAPVALSTDTPSLSFSGRNGTVLPGRTLGISMNNLAAATWTATAGADWIRLDRTSGTLPASLAISADPSRGPLASGSHASTVTLTAVSGGETFTRTLPVSLDLARPTLTANPAALVVKGVNGGDLAGQTLQVALDTGGNAHPWTAAGNQPWMALDATSGTVSALSQPIHVAWNPRSLASGTYAGAIQITAKVNGDTLTASVPVTLALDLPTLTVNPATLVVRGTNGGDLPGQTLQVSLDSGGNAHPWTAAVDQAWMALDVSSGSGSASPSPIHVTWDPSSLASGTHAGTLQVTAKVNGDTLTARVPVTLDLALPTLTVSPSSLVIGGRSGRDLSGQTLQVDLGAGGRDYPWTAAVDQAWMALDAPSGTAGGSPSLVHATWNRQGLAGGTYAGAMTFTAKVNGDVLTTRVPVTLKLDAHRLLVHDPGVAFASMPGLSRTTRTLRVRDNFGQATAWTATSNRPWLAVTASGTAPGSLVLTADPAGLPADTLHVATVTLASGDPTVAGAEAVQVGFCVGSTAPAPVATVATACQKVVLDPIRPYAYVHAGGPSLTVYHVYTGAVVRTLPAVAPSLGSMAIALDGSRLFVSDTSSGKVVPIQLSDFTQLPSWPLDSLFPVDLAYARTNGKGLLITGMGKVFDAELGTSYGTFPMYGAMLASSLDGSRLAGQNTGISPASFSTWRLDCSAMDGGIVLLDALAGGSGGSNGQDIALNDDGSRIYTACGAPYLFPVFDGTGTDGTAPQIQTLPGDAYPCAVEVARDGRILAGANVLYGAVDVWIYEPQGGQLLGSLKVSGHARSLLSGQLKVSGDGLRLVALTDDPSLQFITLAP